MNSTLSAVAAIHKSQIRTDCLYRLPIEKTDAVSYFFFFFFFLNKACGFFGSVELTFFVNSFISCNMASPHLIDISDFAISKISVKSKMQEPFFKTYSTVSKR